MPEEKRLEKASVLVQQVNQLSRSGDLFSQIDVPKQFAGKQCPLCLVKNTCLGPSCLGLSGVLIYISLKAIKYLILLREQLSS